MAKPRRKQPLLALVLAAFALPVAGQTELALTWENALTRSGGVRSAVISPDGSLVAVDTGERIDRIALDDGTTTSWVSGSSPSWSPDSRSVVYRADGDLFTVAVGETEGRRVTNDALDERAPVFSPDGSTIAFYSSRSGSQDIWLVSSSGGTPRQLTRDAMSIDDPRFAPAYSPDGRSIAFVSNADDYWSDDLWLVNVDDGETRKLTSELMASSTAVWSPEGDSIALLGTAKDEYWYEDLAYIYLVDPKSGETRRVEMQVYATDWLHNHRLFWSGDADRLFFLYHERGDLNLWSVASAGGVATRVSHDTGAVRSFHADANGERFVLVRSTPLRGYEADLIPAAGGPLRQLTDAAPRWRGTQEPEEIAYRSHDGLYIQGFLYRPPEGATGPFPALVNVHGGGTNSYLRRENLTEQILASKGYLVLAVNYRGGSGFGREFQDLGVNDWANGQARDAAAAAGFLRGLPESNGKVGIYGYSYGGITSMAAIARVPDAFDAAVPMAGIYDFGDAYENADRLGRIFIKTGHGGSPEERPEVYGVSNTLARLSNIETPLLVMHGERDVRAPYRQYELAVRTLEELGKTFEHKSYPGEPHGFRDPANRIDLYQRLEAFFERMLR